MPEHIRYARNRRELLNDCFCGVGSLAFTSMMAEAAEQSPLAKKPSQHPAAAKAILCLYGRRPFAP